MSRKIKFRVWDGHTKSFFNTPDTHYLPTLRCDKNGIITVEPKDNRYHIMQYTGLKDRNGVEIYEGDVVSMHYFYEALDPQTLGVYEAESYISGEIAFAESSYAVISDGQYYLLSNYVDEPEEELEIVGNIYENPELIKELDDD